MKACDSLGYSNGRIIGVMTNRQKNLRPFAIASGTRMGHVHLIKMAEGKVHSLKVSWSCIPDTYPLGSSRLTITI